MKKILDCRSTGKGAFTDVVNASEGIIIREFDRSRTGNHWKKEIEFSSNEDAVEIHDISNSGKHSCYLLFGDGRTEEICRIGEPPHCRD